MSELIGRRPRWGLSAFVLKVIAVLTMLCDHVGAMLLPHLTVLRVIGRIAFPIFAYFIAEGCRYTRNKRKRFLMILALALFCEMAYIVASQVVVGTVLVTFSCSVLMIYALQALKQAMADKNGGRIALTAAVFVGSIGLTCAVGYLVPMDYGIPGALLPVALSALDYMPGKTPAVFQRLDRHAVRMTVFALWLVLIWRLRLRVSGQIQLYSLLAVIPMALYNGRPGPRVFKYWFYVFFPAHLFILWLVAKLMRM